MIDRSGERKCPDLVMTNDDSIIISDVAVAWESYPLAGHYQSKVTKYSTPAFLAKVRERFGAEKDITVAPFIMGARGIICQLNETLQKRINMTDNDLRTIVVDTLKGSWTSHGDFCRASWRKYPANRP